MHVAIFSCNYPSTARPFASTFVQQIVRALARNNVKCSVISPISIFARRFGKLDNFNCRQGNKIVNVSQM